MMNLRFGLWMATTAVAVVGVTGCATKNWVHTQTAPIVDHTGQLEDKTAANGRAIHDTDDRAQAGIKQAQGALNVVVVVTQRFLDRLTNGLQAGEVNHRRNGVFAENGPQVKGTPDIRFNKLQAAARHCLNPPQ